MGGPGLCLGLVDGGPGLFGRGWVVGRRYKVLTISLALMTPQGLAFSSTGFEWELCHKISILLTSLALHNTGTTRRVSKYGGLEKIGDEGQVFPLKWASPWRC